jgi:hypothetical protein
MGKSKKQHKKNHQIATTVSAPKGMIQSVSTWDLNEIVAIPFPAGSGTLPCDLKIVSGVNGWSYRTFYSGGTAQEVQRDYGATTG